VLQGASLEVQQGKVVALIGANGAGKTTTMRAISGMIKPAKGRVLLNGKPVQGYGAARIAKLGLAHAPEGRKVFGPLSVEDNLLLAPTTICRCFSASAARPRMIWKNLRYFSAPARTPQQSAGTCPAASSRCWPSAAH